MKVYTASKWEKIQLIILLVILTASLVANAHMRWLIHIHPGELNSAAQYLKWYTTTSLVVGGAAVIFILLPLAMRIKWRK